MNSRRSKGCKIDRESDGSRIEQENEYHEEYVEASWPNYSRSASSIIIRRYLRPISIPLPNIASQFQHILSSISFATETSQGSSRHVNITYYSTHLGL